MILLTCLFLFIWSVAGICDSYDREAERKRETRRADERHKDMLNALKKRGRGNNARRIRTVATDVYGNAVAQEIVENIYEDEIIDMDYTDDLTDE